MRVVCLRMITELGHVLNEPTDKDVMLAAHRYVEDDPAFRDWLARIKPEWASFFKGAIA
jgi:hypothetical protein